LAEEARRTLHVWEGAGLEWGSTSCQPSGTDTDNVHTLDMISFEDLMNTVIMRYRIKI